MHVTDLEGNDYALQATVTNNNETKGNQSLSSTIKANKVNSIFIEKIAQMWTITDHDDVEHKIIYCKKKGEGDRLKVDIKAKPLFFDVLDRNRIYERYDEHMTPQVAFDRIFKDTGFTVVLVDSFSAVEWQGFGAGETKTKTFKRAIDRYKCEFRIEGNTVYLEAQIGRDTSIMYRHRLNASNIVQEIDANELWTYARGYGDYEDGEDNGWETAKLEREYTSPLADVIGIRHAPPIKDGRVKNASEMDKSLKALVDESLKVSVSADIHDLRKQGYPIAQSKAGDRVFLIDERIGLNDEVRVISQSVTRNWKGDVIDLNITFGSEGIAKRHQAEISTAINNIKDVIEGNIKLPSSVLDEAILNATKALQSAQTELMFSNGIVAVDPKDPNRLVVYNSAGLGVSVDRGESFRQAITYLGINTDLLTAGTIHTNNIKIVGKDNLFYWDGNEFKAVDPNNSNKYVRITSGLLDISEGAIRIKRPDGYTTVNNGMLNTDFNVQFSPTPHYSSGVEHENYYVKTSDQDPRIIANGRFRRDGRYLKLILGLWTTASGTARMRVRGQGINPTIYATTSESSQDGGVESAQRTITVDLGVPNGSRTSFYVELYSSNGNEVRGYVHSAWLEG